MKKILGFIFSIIIAIIVFMMMIILIPMETKTAEKIELTYIFVDVDGQEYNVFDKIHGAAKDWSFLFKNTGDQNYLSGNKSISTDISSGYTITVTDVSVTNGLENTVGENSISGNHISDDPTNKKITGKNMYTRNIIRDFFMKKNRFKLITKWHNFSIGARLFRKSLTQLDNKNQFAVSIGQKDAKIMENKQDIHNGIEQLLGNQETEATINDDLNLPEGAIEKPMYRNCNTPWDTELDHGDSVLAYEQRTDDPTICNVQKRTCIDGFLNGSYEQSACNENVKYEYTKIKVIAKNQKQIDELIQNPKYAKYDGAVFDADGKIKLGTKKPKTYRNNKNNHGSIYSESSVEQVGKKYFNCRTPRGDTVQHGQFVKAYELPFGFTNNNCQVELRLCSDGDLKGTYSFGSCQYLDMTYEQYNAIKKKKIQIHSAEYEAEKEIFR